jgi:hypothetical protein
MKTYKGNRNGVAQFTHVVGSDMSFTFFYNTFDKITDIYYCKLWDADDEDKPTDGVKVDVQSIKLNELLQSVFESRLSKIYKMKEVK